MNVDKYLVQATPPSNSKNTYLKKYFHNSQVQSGASSQAKNGGAYFSDVAGSIQDPIAVPGPCEVTEP